MEKYFEVFDKKNSDVYKNIMGLYFIFLHEKFGLIKIIRDISSQSEIPEEIHIEGETLEMRFFRLINSDGDELDKLKEYLDNIKDLYNNLTGENITFVGDLDITSQEGSFFTKENMEEILKYIDMYDTDHIDYGKIIIFVSNLFGGLINFVTSKNNIYLEYKNLFMGLFIENLNKILESLEIEPETFTPETDESFNTNDKIDEIIVGLGVIDDDGLQELINKFKYPIPVPDPETILHFYFELFIEIQLKNMYVNLFINTLNVQIVNIPGENAEYIIGYITEHEDFVVTEKINEIFDGLNESIKPYLSDIKDQFLSPFYDTDNTIFDAIIAAFALIIEDKEMSEIIKLIIEIMNIEDVDKYSIFDEIVNIFNINGEGFYYYHNLLETPVELPTDDVHTINGVFDKNNFNFKYNLFVVAIIGITVFYLFKK